MGYIDDILNSLSGGKKPVDNKIGDVVKELQQEGYKVYKVMHSNEIYAIYYLTKNHVNMRFASLPNKVIRWGKGAIPGMLVALGKINRDIEADNG